MHKLYLIYFIENNTNRVMPGDVLEMTDFIYSTEGNHTVYLYAITNSKKLFKSFNSERYVETFKTSIREYDSSVELNKDMNKLSAFVLGYHSFVYRYNYKKHEMDTIEILSTDCEFEYCSEFAINEIIEKVNSLDELFNIATGIVKKKYRDALEILNFPSIIMSEIPWETDYTFTPNALNIFINKFGFTLDKTLYREVTKYGKTVEIL